MLEVEKYKSGIKIKKSNRGKFTSYCGGEVTSACIQRGKNSSDPAVRKRATFAANARKWKHQHGGPFSAENPMPQDNTRVLDANGWNASQRAQHMVEMERTRARRRNQMPRQAAFSPISSSELQRRENQRKQAQFYRDTYHMWQVDPTRPYPKTDQEMIGAFNYAGTAGKPIRVGLATAVGAGAVRQIPRVVNAAKNEAQLFGQSFRSTVPVTRYVNGLPQTTQVNAWAQGTKDLLQFWKPSQSGAANLVKTYVVQDQVGEALNQGTELYYRSQEPSLGYQYNGMQVNDRVNKAIQEGNQDIIEIFTDN